MIFFEAAFPAPNEQKNRVNNSVGQTVIQNGVIHQKSLLYALYAGVDSDKGCYSSNSL